MGEKLIIFALNSKLDWFTKTLVLTNIKYWTLNLFMIHHIWHQGELQNSMFIPFILFCKQICVQSWKLNGNNDQNVNNGTCTRNILNQTILHKEIYNNPLWSQKLLFMAFMTIINFVFKHCFVLTQIGGKMLVPYCKLQRQKSLFKNGASEKFFVCWK